MIKPPLNSRFVNIPPYLEGMRADELLRKYGVREPLEMGSNENALGPPPRAVRAIIESLGKINRYPGDELYYLRLRLGQISNPDFDEKNVIICNGGLELLQLICDSYLTEGSEAIHSEVTWPAYRIRIQASGAIPVQVPNLPDYRQDLDAINRAITERTRAVFLCSPNNPTGELISPNQLRDFLQNAPRHLLTVIDEAYIDFVDDDQYIDTTQYIRENFNVILMRTFSKGRGLAGIRISYLLARQDIIDDLSHAVLSMHLSSLGLIAANASLDDAEYYRRSRMTIKQEREYLYQELTRLGVTFLPSQANFILITKLPVEPGWINEQLLQKGIIVRPMVAFGVPEAIRVTICTHPENERFIRALEEALQRAEDVRR